MLSLRDKGIVESLSEKVQTGDSSPGYDASGSKIVFQKEPETSELRNMLLGNNIDELGVLPPQTHLDEQTIQEFELTLKKGLSGDLRELAEESNYQAFNEALTGLLACRRIPSSIHKEFLSLRQNLPTLVNRAVELNKKVTRGMLLPIACSKEEEEFRNVIDKYCEVKEVVVKLEQEKVHNYSVIALLQNRNKLIDSEISVCVAEAETLKKAAADQHCKVKNIEALGALYNEATVQNSVDSLVIMELQWRDRVAALDYLN